MKIFSCSALLGFRCAKIAYRNYENRCLINLESPERAVAGKLAPRLLIENPNRGILRMAVRRQILCHALLLLCIPHFPGAGGDPCFRIRFDAIDAQ
jgi:hypothetical protein